VCICHDDTARHSALLFRLWPPSWFYNQTSKTEQLYPGPKHGKNFVLHPPPKDIILYYWLFLVKNTTDVQINLNHTHNFTIFSQDLKSLFPISWSHYNCVRISDIHGTCYTHNPPCPPMWGTNRSTRRTELILRVLSSKPSVLLHCLYQAWIDEGAQRAKELRPDFGTQPLEE